MSYPQQPDNWSDPSWPSQTPGFDPKSTYGDPASAPVSGLQPNPYADPNAVLAGGQQPGVAGYPPGYPAGYPGGYAYPVAAPETNGMAIAAMVVSILGILGLCGYGLGGYLGLVGAILGHVSRRQIRERGESGDGMALAGVILGWIATAVAVIATVLIVIFAVWVANQETSRTY